MATNKLYRYVVIAALCASAASLDAAFSRHALLPYPHASGPDEPDARRHQSYHYKYAVHDPTTGDTKSHNEVSDGLGLVKGTYTMVEADGSTRVVEYTADDEHGFRAEVKRIEPEREERVAAYGGGFGSSVDESGGETPAPSAEVPVQRFVLADVLEGPEGTGGNGEEGLLREPVQSVPARAEERDEDDRYGTEPQDSSSR